MYKVFKNSLFVAIFSVTRLFAQQHAAEMGANAGQDTLAHSVNIPSGAHSAAEEAHGAGPAVMDANHAEHAAGGHEEGEFKADEAAFHHISDLNVYSIGPWNLPLPCMLYAPNKGWSLFSSSKFGIDNAHHGSGHKAIDGYVLNHGKVMRVKDPNFPQTEVEVGHFTTREEVIDEKGTKKDVSYVEYNGAEYALEHQSTADGGLFGGGITNFYDFSITKNVAGMFLILALLANIA